MNPSDLHVLSGQIAVPVEHLRYILEQLKIYIPEATVWAFGSRIKGSHRPASDLDLAVLCDKETAKKQLPKLNEVFIESDTPFKVQLLDFNRLPANMQNNIKKEYVILYQPQKKTGDKKNINKQRIKIGFENVCKNSFRFLCEQYGMRCVKSEPTLVIYESKDVFLHIYHEPLSYELCVNVGLTFDQSRKSYGLADVLEMVLGTGHKITTFYQAITPEKVKSSVEDLTQLVREHYHDLLSGNKALFERLAKVANLRADKFMKERTAQQNREKASQAWKNKRYSEVVDLYESIRSELTESEIKKLEYAQKHKDFK